MLRKEITAVHCKNYKKCINTGRAENVQFCSYLLPVRVLTTRFQIFKHICSPTRRWSSNSNQNITCYYSLYVETFGIRIVSFTLMICAILHIPLELYYI